MNKIPLARKQEPQWRKPNVAETYRANFKHTKLAFDGLDTQNTTVWWYGLSRGTSDKTNEKMTP